MRNTMWALGLMVTAAPLAAQDYRFTKQMSAGDHLEISNINGDIDVSRARGNTAEVLVTKRVKHGDGTLVKAILETDRSGVVRVCTIYLNRDANRNSCNGDNSSNGTRRNHNDEDRLDVDMHYEVHVPAGVHLNADNVNGNVIVGGLDATAKLETVNGDIEFDGAVASSLETVNGKIHAQFTRGEWDGTMRVETVNGSVDLAFPSGLNADVRGETVNGGISSPDFPMTIEGKWGPKSFSGRIGRGGPKLTIETVNGEVTLRQVGSSRSNRGGDDPAPPARRPGRRGGGGGI